MKSHVIPLIHRHFFDLISFVFLTVKKLFLVHFCCTFVTRNKIIFITLTSEKPECGHKISDQCDRCPHCGYEVNKKTSDKITDKVNETLKNKNFNSKYLLIIAVVVIAFLVLFNQKGSNSNNNQNNNQNPQQNQNNNVTPSTNNGYSIYKDSSMGVSFEIPNNYKVFNDGQENIYVGQNIDQQGALIPYIIINRYTKYSNAVQLLNDFTDSLRSQYGDVKITINLTSAYIGNNLVYGICYNYTSSGHLVVDNRYAVAISNKLYMIGTREENVNTQEINNVTRHILETLKEGGN